MTELNQGATTTTGAAALHTISRVLAAYRTMATVVGVLLIVLCLVGLPLNEAHHIHAGWFPVGGSAQQLGNDISKYLGVAHGWLYMIFLIVAFVLSRVARWDLGFTVITLLCGTVPVLSFWAERRATRRTREETGLGQGPDQGLSRG